MLVDFMILGSQKCGTTTLFQHLESHPSLVGCSIKEPRYFCHRKDWREGIDGYHELFEQQDGAKYFEASAGLTFSRCAICNFGMTCLLTTQNSSSSTSFAAPWIASYLATFIPIRSDSPTNQLNPPCFKNHCF